MAEEEKEQTQEDDYEDDCEDEIARLEARILTLEEELERCGGESSPAVRWAGWILGTLVGATSLALIVVLLGGGLPGECDCDDEQQNAAAGEASQEQQQQAALERLLRQHSRDFQECFEGWASQHTEELRGGWSVLVRLEIEADPGGTVQEVDASGEGLPQQLGQCLEQRVRRWTFPGPGPYTMELPFAIEGEAGAEGATPAAGDAGSATDGSSATDAG